MKKSKRRLNLGSIASDLLNELFAAGDTLIPGMANPSYALRYGNDAAKRKYYGRSKSGTYKAKKFLLLRKSIVPYKNSYKLTDQGYADLLELRIQEADIYPDDRTLMILFDIPETARKKRDRLRALLYASSCVPLQRSVWITRNDILNPLHEIVHQMGLTGCIRTYYATIVRSTRS